MLNQHIKKSIKYCISPDIKRNLELVVFFISDKIIVTCL